MATVDLTRVLNLIRVRLPGAVESAIQLEMFAAVDEFLQTTNAWKEGIPVSVVSGNSTYALVATGAASIHRLMLFVNSQGVGVWATMEEPGTLVLNTVPTQADASIATVALKITDPTDKEGNAQLPAWIVNKYGNDFVDGTVGRLMSQPAKPYSNPTMAAYHLRRWRNAMAVAAGEVNRKNVYGGQRWRFPRNFA